MRPLLLAVLLLGIPATGLGQTSPRSLALDVGISRDLAADARMAVPVGLVATFWLVGDLDAAVRAAWKFGPRTDGRGTDGAFEAGAGLRYSLVPGPLRPQLLAGASFVEVLGSPFEEADVGVRLSAAAALEALPTRDFTVSLVVEASQLLLASGVASPSLGVGLRVGAYF